MTPALDPLVAAVRTNCHISDARHARELTMCTYLLEMRELYRWERGVAFGAPLPQSDVRAWIAEREALWSRLESATEQPLPLASRTVGAYDVEAANLELRAHGLVYGAGVGLFGKPQFFLAALEREERRDGARILVAGREFARDLSVGPAASRGNSIYVRLESLRRLLWERAEAWRGSRSGGALERALILFGFAAEPQTGMSAMMVAETESLILHELGECRVAARLGPAWEAMLGRLKSKRNEIFVRSVRDHLADCLVTLPALLERRAFASVHFWFANLGGMRRALFPAIGSAYAGWREGANDGMLRAIVEQGALHWQQVADEILSADAQSGDDAIDALARNQDILL